MRNWIEKNAKLALGILIIVVLAVTITWKLTSGNASSNQSKLNAVTSKVGKLLILPTDEKPTLATVTDKSQLKDPYLASKAQNGDKILVYTQNHIVIIYRPGINKIAAVGSVSADAALPEAKGATLTVLDGTSNPQKTQEIIGKIKSLYPDIKVTDGGNATRQDLPNTIVVDNTNQKDNLLFALVDKIPAKRGVVPLGVQKPPTDMIVIVGKD